jgi:hypothetical protein
MCITREEVKQWLARGKAEGAIHLFVVSDTFSYVSDTFSYEQYPVFVKPGENVADIRRKYNGVNMQRLKEDHPIQ